MNKPSYTSITFLNFLRLLETVSHVATKKLSVNPQGSDPSLLLLPFTYPRLSCPEKGLAHQFSGDSFWKSELIFHSPFGSSHFSISSANIYWHLLFASHDVHSPRKKKIDRFIAVVKSNNQTGIKFARSINDNSLQWTCFWKPICGRTDSGKRTTTGHPICRYCGIHKRAIERFWEEGCLRQKGCLHICIWVLDNWKLHVYMVCHALRRHEHVLLDHHPCHSTQRH